MKKGRIKIETAEQGFAEEMTRILIDMNIPTAAIKNTQSCFVASSLDGFRAICELTRLYIYDCVLLFLIYFLPRLGCNNTDIHKHVSVFWNVNGKLLIYIYFFLDVNFCFHCDKPHLGMKILAHNFFVHIVWEVWFTQFLVMLRYLILS